MAEVGVEVEVGVGVVRVGVHLFSMHRPGKSCKRCKRRLRTFCQKSRYFEDILSQISGTFG